VVRLSCAESIETMSRRKLAAAGTAIDLEVVESCRLKPSSKTLFAASQHRFANNGNCPAVAPAVAS
jgi:hypothetical protein